MNPVEISKILFVKGQTIDPLNWLYLREKIFLESSHSKLFIVSLVPSERPN